MGAELLTPQSRTKSSFNASRFPDSHDPFWPRIELSVLRECLQLGEEVSEARLALAVRFAAIDAAREFASWRSALRRRGYRRLEEMDGHANGRALSVCYRYFIAAAVRRGLLAGPAAGGEPAHE
ncbi:head completion/stabilization protein [Pseudomonas putida]|uniref:Head completion/stabilization protein n=1 Tax=Pseudomonas putida TaxID=303 RepID=A0A6I6Y0Q5_PSEPU|nr:head completion/stabilization protein [Pseudomonas putida]QHG66022.1 head completion/stabilization protein [Pseudomonas putida]